MFELADGRVFFSGGRMDDDLPVAPCVIDLNKNPCKPKLFQVQPGDPANQSASVLLPPAQDQRVMCRLKCARVTSEPWRIATINCAWRSSIFSVANSRDRNR